jgi:16S rRNA A1518/A1519 N6-dimethyltransferase RsmA/KsgA/DIM1 with predicted DNA glycosylase/AP lyase activity
MQHSYTSQQQQHTSYQHPSGYHHQQHERVTPAEFAPAPALNSALLRATPDAQDDSYGESVGVCARVAAACFLVPARGAPSEI